MTVRLLVEWPDPTAPNRTYKPNNLLTTDAATEAGLVAANLASTNLTGGTPYEPGPVQQQRYDVYANEAGALVKADGSAVPGGGAAPAKITGGNQVGDVLTVEKAAGWQFTTGQWYLDGVATGSATAGLSLTQLAAAVGKAYGFQPTGIPFRALAAVTVAAGVVPTVPGNPGAPVAVAGDGTVSATWAAAEANGATITNHRLRWNGGTAIETGSATLSGSIPAANDVAGTLEVAAYNAVGWGPWSEASNSVTPQAAASALRIPVVTSLGAPASVGSAQNTNGYKQFNSQCLIQNNAGTTIKDGTLRFKFVNAITDVNGGGYMVNAPAATFQVGLSQKLANGGAVNNTNRNLLTFGGQSSYSAAAGEEFWSDPVTFGSDMLAGDYCRLNVFVEFATAPPVMPACNVNGTSNDYDLSEGAVSGLASKATGTARPTTRINSKRILTPVTVTGEPLNGTRARKGILIIGDSITSGADDSNSTAYVGFAQKGVASPNSTVANTWVVASTEGYSYVSMMADTNRRRLSISPADGCSLALCFLSVNDIRSGQTSAQIRANMQALKTALAAKGVSKLIVATCFTCTNAANNAEPSTGAWSRLNQLNSDLIANNGIGDGYFDANAITRDPSNPNLWKPGYVPADGVHPTAGMHTLLAQALGSYLDGLPV
nr:SGNH/GDSL hydrolase family protein [Variovorax boronicumulans]